MDNHDLLGTAISRYAAGDASALDVYHLDNEYMQYLHHIVNNYSVLLAPSVFEILAYCVETPAPAEALERVSEFLERTAFDFSAEPVENQTACILASVFSVSNALSRRLNGDPSLVTLLYSLDAPLDGRTDPAYYLSAFQQAIGGFSYSTERRRAVHRMHTVQLMRICARNTDPEEEIAVINRELSLLADAVIDTCLALAHDELTSRLEVEWKPHHLVVLGLGKLGGCELNVSSDIDLIYVCDETGDTWGRYDSLWFHTMLAEKLTRMLSEMTGLGILYRVDTRLRADGASGPLVRTTVEYFRYLEMRGEAWERQMLIKARPVAGNIDLGVEFLTSLEHFIFPASISRSPHSEIVALKNRIEARLEQKGDANTHLKLMPGGIRDIEFVTQCLQLLMGGLHSEVRSRETLDAIDRLHTAGALSDYEETVLTGAYRLYRRIENAQQWREMLATFSIPGTGDDAAYLAAFLGYPSDEGNPGNRLVDDIHRYLKEVRQVYDDVFATESMDTFEEISLYAAMHPSGDDRTRRFLESLGFPDPNSSGKTLSRLAFGEVRDIHESMAPQSVQRFIPTLLKALSEQPDPAGALERFQHIVAAYRARSTLFGIFLDNPAFFNLLLSITHASVFISEILMADPSLLDWLVEAGGIDQPLDRPGIAAELSSLNLSERDNRRFSLACRAVKQREKLRIGARDISCITTTAETFAELTGLAELIVKAIYDRVAGASGQYGDIPFCIIAAGRLGAGTMNFGSDLDLIFVYDIPASRRDDPDIPAVTARAARNMLHLITGGGGAAKIYDVDARLRPEGVSASLTVSFDEYRRYLDQRASIWERLALVRARPVSGDGKLFGRFTEMLEWFVYSGKLFRPDIERIVEIRAMMVEKAAVGGDGEVHIKTGAGGIADIDFIAQTYAVHFGADHPAIRKRDTVSIIESLVDERLMDAQSAGTLVEQYHFLLDLDKALRIGSGRSVDTLPADEHETARIARLVGFRNVRRFRKRLVDAVTLTRELYEKMMATFPVSD